MKKINGRNKIEQWCLGEYSNNDMEEIWFF